MKELIKRARRAVKLLSYVNKKLYPGKLLRGMLRDKHGSVYCDRCGNIANAVGVRNVWVTQAFGFRLNIPLCNKHFREDFPELARDGEYTPVVGEYGKKDKRSEEDVAYGIHPEVRRQTDAVASAHDSSM